MLQNRVKKSSCVLDATISRFLFYFGRVINSLFLIELEKQNETLFFNVECFFLNLKKSIN